MCRRGDVRRTELIPPPGLANPLHGWMGEILKGLSYEIDFENVDEN